VADVEILGLKELERRLKALPKEISGKNLLGKALRKGANLMRDDAKNRVPFGKGEGNDDDVHIRDHIKVRRDPRPDMQGKNEIMYVKPFATKKFPVYYWRFLEFGTTKMPAIRFLTKAFESQKQDAVRAFQIDLGKSIVRETKKLQK
jgi:HK97 gp10 family phage protein